MHEHTKQLIDSSTGIRNYFAFKDDLKKEFVRSGRYNYWSSLGIIHIEGEDLFFSELIQLLKNKIRGSDTIYRIVDRKIGIIMPHTMSEGAIAAMSRFEQAYKENIFKKIGKIPAFSSSVACFNGNEFINFTSIINALEKELIFTSEINKIHDIFEGLKESSIASKISRKEHELDKVHESLRAATHKLNNKFQIILGNIEILLLTLDKSDDLYEKITLIRKEMVEASSIHHEIFRLIRNK